MTEVVLVWWMSPEVWSWVWEVVVVVWSLVKVMICVVQEIDGRNLGGGETRWWVCYRFPRVCREL